MVTVRTTSCLPDGNTPVRHIQLREHTQSDIRCDVLYEKPDEGGNVKTIWTARNDVGFCASRFGDFVQKHRVKFGWHCSESTLELPKPDTHRSTRKLARWYLEHGSLKIVRSAVDEGDALRPGVVLFYGQQGKRYDNATPEELFKIGSGIAHMGVVIDVSRVDGQVVGYSLFHGRRTGTNASITNYHRRSPSLLTHPPYGNGDEHWVAYASILPAGTLVGEEDLIAEYTEEPELIAEITDEP